MKFVSMQKGPGPDLPKYGPVRAGLTAGFGACTSGQSTSSSVASAGAPSVRKSSAPSTSTATSNGPPRKKMLPGETEETKNLSHSELQRLVLLEQLQTLKAQRQFYENQSSRDGSVSSGKESLMRRFTTGFEIDSPEPTAGSNVAVDNTENDDEEEVVFNQNC